MSRTRQQFKDQNFPAVTKKKVTDVKNFGYTSGLHSQFEQTKKLIRKEFEETPRTSPWYAIRKQRWMEIKDKSYAEKGVDYVKYGYGNGTKKENRVKNYKKEI